MALLLVLSAGSTGGDFLEQMIRPSLDKIIGGVFASIGRIVGGLGIALTTADAIMSSCGFGATIGIMVFGILGLALTLLATLYLGPLGTGIAAVLISVGTELIQSKIKEDEC